MRASTDLRLGIAEAAVALEHHRPAIGRQHEAGVEQAAERPPGGGQRAHRRHEHVSTIALRERVVDQRRRRVASPMPPVFGPASPSRTVLWSSADASSASRVAVAQRHHRHLAPGEPLLDHDARAGVAERPLGQHARARPPWPRPCVDATTTPLPAARPSALTTTRARLRVDERLGARADVVEHAEGRGRDAGVAP